MAELSDDSLSDDDALKRDEDNEGPFGGLVFHWATDPTFRNFHFLEGHPNLRKLDMGYARLTEADVAFLPSLPELAFLEIGLSNLDKSVVEATLKRCPKLKDARL